jgi:hypothetical protein
MAGAEARSKRACNVGAEVVYDIPIQVAIGSGAIRCPNPEADQGSPQIPIEESAEDLGGCAQPDMLRYACRRTDLPGPGPAASPPHNTAIARPPHRRC